VKLEMGPSKATTSVMHVSILPTLGTVLAVMLHSCSSTQIVTHILSPCAPCPSAVMHTMPHWPCEASGNDGGDPPPAVMQQVMHPALRQHMMHQAARAGNHLVRRTCLAWAPSSYRITKEPSGRCHVQ
jgi:hypothetical protein